MFSLYRRHEESCRFRAKGVRHIQCRCPVWMEGRDEYGKRQRRSLKTRSWAHAQVRLNAIESGPPEAAPAHAHPASPQLPAAIATYLDDCRARRLQPSTLVSYTNTLGHLSSFLPACDVAGIDLDTLTRFRAERGKITAASSMKEIQTLRAFFGFCADRNWISFNPARRVKAPISDRLPTLPFEPSEVSKILEACDRIDNPNPREIPRARLRARALVLTLLYSGLRISDAVKLRRDALDMRTGQLLIRIMKTRAPLYVRLPPIALAALQATPGHTGKESDWFFWSGDSKLSTAVGSARRTIDCLMKLASITNGHPHRFRDTFSVGLLQNGADLRTVQLLLGHASVRTTEKHYAPYLVSMQRNLDAAVSTLHFGLPAAPDAHPPVNPQHDALRDLKPRVLPFARAKRG